MLDSHKVRRAECRCRKEHRIADHRGLEREPTIGSGDDETDAAYDRDDADELPGAQPNAVDNKRDNSNPCTDGTGP
jgi:hypothetical protein